LGDIPQTAGLSFSKTLIILTVKVPELTGNNITASEILEWDDNQWRKFKYWLHDLLEGEVVELQFVKVDGSHRTMLATRHGGKAARKVAETSGDRQAPVPRSRPPTKKTEHNIIVWDTVADDWRTIKIKNLTNIYTLILKYDYRENTSPFDPLDFSEL
jgi:hypothetical protein